MTQDEILNMPAGREMDELIARIIYPEAIEFFAFPCYSTDISAAWEVVENRLRSGISSEIISHYPGKDYVATFWTVKNSEIENLNDFDEHIARAETAPLAICRSVLISRIGQ